VEGSCEHGNEPSGSIKCWEFLEWLHSWHLHKGGSAPWVSFSSEVEADKAARNLPASISSAYRLSTSKITLLDFNNDLRGLDRLLKHKQRLRKLWEETRDPACKTAVNWVSKSIRWITRKKALEPWETKISNAEVTPQAIWPIAKSLLKRDRPRAPTAIHCSSGLKFHPSEKANAIADCLEIQFTPRDLCDENHERRVTLKFKLY
jgi:hypothetical protein